MKGGPWKGVVVRHRRTDDASTPSSRATSSVVYHVLDNRSLVMCIDSFGSSCRCRHELRLGPKRIFDVPMNGIARFARWQSSILATCGQLCQVTSDNDRRRQL